MCIRDSTKQGVVAGPAIKGVVALQAVEGVGPGVAVEGVITAGAVPDGGSGFDSHHELIAGGAALAVAGGHLEICLLYTSRCV